MCILMLADSLSNPSSGLPIGATHKVVSNDPLCSYTLAMTKQ